MKHLIPILLAVIFVLALVPSTTQAIVTLNIYVEDSEGLRIPDAAVYVSDSYIGSTSSTGYISYTHSGTSSFDLRVTKSGYCSRNVTVPSSETSITITLLRDDIILTLNKDTVVRGDDFALTITGCPNTDYVLWVKGSSGETNISVPRIQASQIGVSICNEAAGAHIWKTGTSVIDDVPGTAGSTGTNILSDGTGSFANVRLNSAGTRTVSFTTNQSTLDKTWTFRVERVGAPIGEQYDEVKVRIEKGTVTIAASGDRSYYHGQDVIFSGTNTDSNMVYLFITGPNLAGSGVKLDNLETNSVTGNAATFVERTVKSDNTWDYTWRTRDISISPGTYTIYVVSQPNNKNSLTNVKYATVSVVIRKPFITAATSATTIPKGNSLFIRGTAEASPSAGITIWIFGQNYYSRDLVAVNNDASFEKELTGEETENLAYGPYHVIAQHPMANNQFDVIENVVGQVTYIQTIEATPIGTAPSVGTNAFIAEGSGRLQGSDAAEALERLLNLVNIDDTYAELTFNVGIPTPTPTPTPPPTPVPLPPPSDDITLSVSGDGVFYLGEEIVLSGTNTASENIYFFITGPNLPRNGMALTSSWMGVTDGDPDTFTHAPVQNGDTFEYVWDTALSMLDSGTYTIFAAAQPRDRDNLAETEYNQIQITLRKPYVFARIVENEGMDQIFICGKATGCPSHVVIWVFGQDYYERTEVSVDEGSLFEYELTCDTAQNIINGQCFIVIQHPMINKQFDVEEVTVGGITYATIQGVTPVAGQASNDYFPVDGTGFHLKGSEAADALIQLLSSNPNIDDTYMSLTYPVEQPAPSPYIEWQRFFGGSDRDSAQSIQQTSDGGYIVAGSTSSNDGDVSGYRGGGRDIWIVKLDENGKMQWQRCLGGSGWDYASNAQQTSDGGYILVGMTESNDGDVSGNPSPGTASIWVVKLNTLGVIQWQRSLGGSNHDIASSIQQTSDGGYILAGETESNDGDVSGYRGNGDAWIVKLDTNGIIQWQRCLGGSSSDSASSVQQTSDGGYIFAGSTRSNDGDVWGNPSPGKSSFWVVKLNSAGAIQWQKCLGGSNRDSASSIQQTSDGGYIMAGTTGSNDGDVTGNPSTEPHFIAESIWIVKLSSGGALQWQRCLGGSGWDYASNAQQTSDGGYIVAGSTGSNDGDVSDNHGSSGAWVVKLTPTSEIDWQRCYGGSGSDSASSIQPTSDGGFIFSGSTESYDGDVIGNHVRMGFWVVKIPNTISIPFTPSTLTLSPGWNFISVPKFLAEGNNTATIFSDVDTDGRSIFLYNATLREWEILTPSSPIKPLDAYWIYTKNITPINLDYRSDAVQVPPSKQLVRGWNAIGFSAPEPATARDTLNTISSKWGQVLGWDADEQLFTTAIVKGGTGAYTDERLMYPMQGYWIAMTEDGVLYALS